MIFNYTKKEYYPTKHDKFKNTTFSIKKENQSLNVYITAMFRIVVIKMKKKSIYSTFVILLEICLLVTVNFIEKRCILKKGKAFISYTFLEIISRYSTL